jgi:heat shock protein 4
MYPAWLKGIINFYQLSIRAHFIFSTYLHSIRAKFVELVEPVLQRIHPVLEKALNSAGINKDDVYCVEIIGGSTRIPAVKQRISAFFGKELHTTLNMDECISKGCAFMVSQCRVFSS